MELTIEQALQQGVTAHKEGKLPEAERLYRAILQSQPTHPDANHNLGVLAVSVNKAVAALPLFKTALEANPKIEQFWLSYIDALIKEKQFDNAKQVIQRAKKQGLARKKLNSLKAQLVPTPEPENANSANPSQQQLNSLLKHYQTGRYGDAEKLAISLTQQFPEHQFGWKVLGAVFGQAGRNLEALSANQKAVEITPQDTEAHYNLGVTLQELHRSEEAEASYRQAIALKSDYAGAHSNLGVTLQELGKLEEAEISYRQAIALKPEYALAHSNLGNILQELGRLEEAEASYRQAITLKPDFAEAHFSLGEALKELGRLGDAVKCFNAVSAIDIEDTLGVSVQLASMRLKSIPNSTPKNYMKSFYKKKSTLWGLRVSEQYKGHYLIRKAIQHTHNNLKKVSILDLGCGTGSLASFLHTYARILHGVDLSPDMLIEATKTGLYDSLCEQDLKLYLDKTPHHYDMIVAAAVMVHFFDLESLFSMIHDKLKPNGKVVFSVFEGIDKDRDLNAFLMYSHSHDYITKLAKGFNFEICYQDQDVHEYQKEKPINALIYVLKKTSKT